MNFLAYLLFLLFAYPLSILPFKVLYSLADGLYGILYKGIGYRKKVVRQNLANAFPEKPESERLRIEQQFYRHLCDLIVENIKMLTISKEEVVKRCTFDNPDLLHQYYRDGKSLTAAVAHYNNWELGGLSLALHSPHKVLAIYKPLANPWFNRFIQRFRKRFGSYLVSKETAARTLLQHRDDLTMSVFITDQTPLHVEQAHWTTFLNQPTPVFQGLERIARKTDDPVVFCHMRRKTRGYYSVKLIEVTKHPSQTEEGDITETHTKLLEQIIAEHPSAWLWSHRRWKRSHRAPQHMNYGKQ